MFFKTAKSPQKINKKEIVKPSAIDNIFTYNGSKQTYNIESSDYYTVSNNEQIIAGEYKVTVTLNDIKNSM